MKEIIFKTKFGSHLYGTDTIHSDLDYKAVFKESLENIILGKGKETYISKTGDDFSRNTKDDVDVEKKELRRFLRDCMGGQTYALDMLFSPSKMWVESTDTWARICFYRDKLLSKNVAPYIGYCRQQAGKYGLKGSRLGELIRVIDYLKNYKPKQRLDDAIGGIKKSEFVYTEEKELITNNQPRKVSFLNVLGKEFEFNTHIDRVLYSLGHLYEKYGQRSVQAMNNEGIDWKAISHAFRCCYQLKHLATWGEIIFPLPEAEYLKQIKSGFHDYNIIQNDLPKLMEEAVEDIEKSKVLPEQPDREFWNEFIISQYKA